MWEIDMLAVKALAAAALVLAVPAGPWTSTASATLLARNGVWPGVAQELMRHRDIRLTMNTYTHLVIADTAGAVAALPAF